jgi:pimeloyl-ACP methyl ester carboxylesterase
MPVQYATKRLNVRGTELATVDQGSGTPILLIHGFPFDHAMWDEQIGALSARYRVVAPDLRGFGQSGVTEGKVTMEAFADDLAALLDALGIDQPIVFCGLSMGGYVAWQFWRKYGRRVRGLIVCDTRAVADTPEAAEARRTTADRVLREGPGVLLDTMIPKLFAESTRKHNPEAVEAVRRMVLAADAQGIAAAARGMAQRPNVTAMLARIDCPTLVLVGEFDAISPLAEMQSLAEAIPHARLVRIAAAGHLAPLENAREANAAMLEFLAQLI